MAGDVVLGYDGSDGAKAALPVAVTVAKAFGAKLTIVFGYEPSPMGGESTDYRLQLEKLGTQAAEAAQEDARAVDPTVEIDRLIVPMRPVESLLAAAEERQARMIVVGTNGERPILGAILGSVPHKLLHRSSVPVLVVPVTDDAE